MSEAVLSVSTRPLWVGRLILGGISLGMFFVLARVAQLQTRPEPQVAAMLGTQVSRTALMGRRGTLLDRRGRPMATTRVAQRLFIDPKLIVDRNTFSERVAYTLDYDPTTLEKKLAKHDRSRYIVIDPRLNDQRSARVQKIKLPGLAVEPVLVRDYPQGILAGQLVGFVGVDGEGLDGLERAFNARLTATPGSLGYLRDHRRQALWVDVNRYTPQTDGQDIRLSLDLTIQAIAQTQLAQAVERFGAKSGQLIVMDPNTGEILAMANYPTFAPEDFRTADAALRRNRCVTDLFEPGSIFKPIVWAAMTDMGVAQPTEKIDCTDVGVWRTPYRRRLRDAHGIGTVDWDTVLVKSSNIGMAKVTARMSLDQLYHIVRAFGFGQVTGSGLPGESPGLLNPRRKWTKYSQSSIPMGQEIGVTALQMVRAFCALANDGQLVTPTIEYLDVADPQQALVQERILSPAAAAHARSVLRRVITQGTGHNAQSDLYALFGKTGTAQLPDAERGGYYQDRYVSSFLAGAPVDNPRLVVGCFIHEPDKSIGHYGGTVAAPAVKAVIEQALLYMGVPTRSTMTQPQARLSHVRKGEMLENRSD